MIRILVLLVGAIVACSGGSENSTTTGDDNSEVAQQLGDVMSSIDELGGGDGGYTFHEMKSAERMFARLQLKENRHPWLSVLLPDASATSCSTATTFGSCAGDAIVRSFNSCTIGSYTLDGTVVLTWNDGNAATTCAIDTNGDTITRVPNFSITGGRIGSLSVSKSGTIGQRVTQTAPGVFSFTNDGIDRVLTVASTSVLDFTTETTGALTITGSSRSGRVLSSTGGAAIRVTNNLTAVTCDYVPSAVTWGATCSCPTSGSWSATCSDGKSSTYTITGCRTGSLVMGTTTESVVLDRCYTL